MAEGLKEIATPDLEHLRREIRRGLVACPITGTGLASCGLAHLVDNVPLLDALDKAACTAVLDATLAERRAPGGRIELVWTGPEALVSGARDTAVVVQELFASATHSVLIAGYSFDHGDELLKELHVAMSRRGVQTEIFLDAPGTPGPTSGQEARAGFLTKNWPFGPPLPSFLVDRRALDAASHEFTSLHAKCVVVDSRRALVTSANFTDRGHSRNIELGVLVDDAPFAAALARQWRGAVETGLFRYA